MFIPNVQGQSISISSSVDTLVPCGAADTFFVTLNNQGANTLTNVSIVIGLFEGLQYVNGSLAGSGMGLISSSPLDSIVISSLDIPPFQSISFSFQAIATCFASDSATLVNSLVVDYVQGRDSFDLAPVTILRPALSIQQIQPSSVTDSLNGTFQRCIRVINGGNGWLDSFSVAIETDTNLLGYSNFILSPSNIPIVPIFIGDSIVFNLTASQISQVGNLNDLFEKNETLEICYDVKIKTCDNAPTTINSYWGCYSEVCENHSQNANVIVNDLQPLLTFNRQFFRNLCYGAGASVIKIAVENTGTGIAKDMTIEFWMGGSTVASSGYISSIDTSSIRWKDTNGNSIVIQPSYVENGSSTGNYACLGPNPIRKARILLPDLAPGQRDTLIYETTDCCKDWCATSPALSNGSYYKASYRGRCDTTQFVYGPAQVSGYTATRILSLAPNGPSDVNSGDTATYCLEHSYFGLLQTTPASQNPYLRADIILPSSLSYTGVANDFFFVDPQGDLWNPYSVQVIGDTIRGLFLLPPTAGVTLEKINLKFRVVANCSGPCSGGIDEIQYNLYQVPDTSCPCEARVLCTSFPVNVHCGICNCPNGGIQFTNFQAYRANLGLPDNNNDGIPDASGTIDSTLIRMNYIMFGDTLETVFEGKIDTTLSNPLWTIGYASSEMTGGNRMTAISSQIEIFDFSTLTVFSCPLNNAVSTNLGGGDYRFEYPFDTSLACLPSGFVFDEGDSITITARYRMHLNPGGATIGQSITNDFAMVNPVSNDTGSCDSYSGNFVQVGYYYTNCCRNTFNASECNTITVSQNYYLSIGNCCSNYSGGNLFHYEYRHWAVMDQLEAVIPTGYNFISATVQDVRTAGSQSSFATPQMPVTPTITGQNLVFDMSPLYQANGGPIFPSDDGFYGILRIILEPTCRVNPAERVNYTYTWDPISQLTGPNSANIVRAAYDSLKYLRPNLELTPAVPVVPGISPVVTWDFQIENNTNLYAANNTWFGFFSPSGQVLPIDVVDLNTLATIPNVNGIYQLGTILADSIENYRISANYANCDLDSILILSGWDCPGYPVNLASASCVTDSAWLYVDPQPADLQGSLTISSDTVDICDSLLVEINVLSSQVADIKDLVVSLLLPVSGGLVVQPGSAELQYPTGNTFTGIPDPTFSSPSWNWNINAINATIAALNLPGAQQPDSNSFTIRFYLETNCNFASGERFFVRLRGNRLCGSSLPPLLLTSNPININGAVQPYTTIVNGQSSQNGSCPMNKTLSVTMVNTGTGTTSPGDSIFVELSPGYSYAGNFVSGQNAPAVTAPDVQVLPSGTILGWELPVGLVTGDTVQFDFDLDVYAQVNCGTDIATVRSVVNSNLFCARSNSNCQTSVVTGSFVLNIPIQRPDLSMTGFSSSIAPVTGGYYYTYNGTIENSGVSIPNGTTTTVSFYCDNDNSGGLSAGDNLLSQYSTTNGISTISPHPFSGNFTIPSTGCSDTNDIYAVILADTLNGYCLCDTASANTNVVLPVSNLSIQGEALSNENMIFWNMPHSIIQDHFVLERLNQGVWEGIVNVLPANNGEYIYRHQNPLTEEKYRAVMVDQSGSKLFSQILLLNRSTISSFQMYPNPTQNVVFIEGPPNASVKITNLLGQEIIQLELENSSHRIVTSDWPAGIYLVEFSYEGEKESKKLVLH